MKAYIEIAKGSCNKYEFDKSLNALVLDRILPEKKRYPHNYGFIPKTLCGDGDPLDIFVLSIDPIMPGVFIDVEVLGYLETEDENGDDPKLVATIKNDPNYDKASGFLNMISIFIKEYKEAEGKFIKIGKWYGKKEAKELILKSRGEYNVKSS